MKLILSVESIRFPVTGIGRYTYELAKQLKAQPDIEELRFFSGHNFLTELPLARQRRDGGHLLKQRVGQSYLAIKSYQGLKEALQDYKLQGCQDFVFHGPNYHLPKFPGPSVATFHDLSPFTWSHCFEPQRARALQRTLKKTLDRATALITDSTFTRLELADYFSWPLNKIHAIPLASGPDFKPRTPKEIEEPLLRYGLVMGGYTLFVGTIEPRKNIEMLLDAYTRMPLALRRHRPLILSGHQGWRSEHIHSRIAAAQAQGWARYLGFTPAEDLPALFAGARLFAYPSHYEGFGLPVLEAMSSGIPVVCSNSSSLPEVAGGAALMCAADDVDQFAELLIRGLQDDIWRHKAIRRGLEHAAQYTWSRCAAETTAVYKSVLDSSER